MLPSNENRKKNLILAEIPPYGAFYSRFNIYLLPASNSLQRLQFFLISPLMHLKSIVTFVHACLDGAILTSVSIFLSHS